jgi:hypothetical protein
MPISSTSAHNRLRTNKEPITGKIKPLKPAVERQTMMKSVMAMMRRMPDG